mgnify:CR=1 FL=1
MRYLAVIISVLLCCSLQPTISSENTKINNSIVTDNHSSIDKESLCPNDMVEVEGDYCPNLQEICLKWGDPNNKGPNGPVQCLEFKYPTKCLSKAKHMRFCIDKYPLPNIKGELPTTQLTWYDAKNICEKAGKRLCGRIEFTQACRGPNNKPYPYGDGYHRDGTACNCDRTPWLDPSKHSFEELDKRVPNGSMDKCVSDYGVYDLVGNNDRFVYNETQRPYKSALVGGHAVLGARNRCSSATLVHSEGFSYYETRSICCRNISK